MLLAQNYQPNTYHQRRLAQQTQQAASPLHNTQVLTDRRTLPQQPEEIQGYPQRLDIDLDADIDVQAIASPAPLDQLSALTNITGIAVPRRIDPHESLFDVSASSSPAAQSHLSRSALEDSASILTTSDFMQHQDAWLSNGQLTPKSLSRLSHHHRESSLSSLGSAGPASPYSQNTSNPHIAVTDSTAEAYHGLHAADDFNYQLAKGPNDGFFANYPNYAPDAAASPAYASMARKGDRGMLPPPDYSSGPSHSRPVSVASSIAGESQAAPSLGAPEDDRRRKTGFGTVPKLDRTMTDVYGDELYNPNFAITAASPSQASQLAMSPTSDLFAQRLQAANSQHLNAAQSPVSMTSRGRSPFRQGSPLAPAPVQDFASVLPPSNVRFSSAQALREQTKAEQDAQALRQQLARAAADTGTPQTISPKDAMLEFNDADVESHFPLFPQPDQQTAQQQSLNPFGADQLGKAGATGTAYNSLGLDSAPYAYASTQLQAGLQIPQQYPFIAQPRHQISSLSSGSGTLMPSRVSPIDSGSPGSVQSSVSQRPATTSADGGTYTCTYHGCTLRFETPALLQKHKREGHRQAHGIGGTRRPDAPAVVNNSGSGMTSSLINSQAGPHRCDRINPSTGKPCSTVFSRPYDLTRHEDTIHNARKQKVRCNLCTDEKTFSRADALTRHYRVCHPDVDLPGKHRRRTAAVQ